MDRLHKEQEDEDDSDDDEDDALPIFAEGAKEARLKKMMQKDLIKQAMDRLHKEQKEGSDTLLKLLYAVPIQEWQSKVKEKISEDANLETLLSTKLIPELQEPFKD